MKSKVQKWGNSLALRIPKAYAVEVGLAHETSVEITVQDRKLVVRPVVPSAPTLEELLAGVTRKNRHAEVATGPATGNKAW